VPFVAVVTGALLANGLIEIYFTYRESRTALGQIQREKAHAAALSIENFVRAIEHQMGWTTQPQVVAPAGALEQRRIDYLRLQRQVPAITEVSYLDGTGHEQLRVSRVAMDVVAGGADASEEPRFRETRAGRVWYGPVTFRKESEPYMTLAVPHGTARTAPVTAAEVNLKFIWDVVSQIRIGKTGLAYVVDSQGHLIAHPDIGLVLRKTDLSTQKHVQAARSRGPKGTDQSDDAMLSTNLAGQSTLVAHEVITPLGWIVFVEQPVLEAFAPLRGAILRTGMLMLLGVFVSAVASLALARKIGRPIEMLQAGAARIGGGDLTHRIDVRTKDELQELGEQFNRMAGALQESYATLEQKVEDRTRELTETLEQQTATSEILRVISSSPTDVQPVFAAVLESAVRLGVADFGGVFRFDGELIHLVASHAWPPAQLEIVRGRFPMPPGDGSLAARSIRDREIVQVRDYALERSVPWVADHARPRGTIAIPMLREGNPVGSIVIARSEPGVFSDKHIVLLQTFADQAVIAIENVRLFTELEAKNRTITEALEQQTATAEILRVISSSPTDVQPVFDSIVSSAARLLDGHSANLLRVVGDELHCEALTSTSREADAATLATFPVPLSTAGLATHVLETRRPYTVTDVATDPFATERLRQTAPLRGFRSMLMVPMVRYEQRIGVITVTRRDPGAFSEDEVALLQTFADQAVIAIENVRLFAELQAREAELTRSVDELSALGEVGRALSSTLDLPTVLDTILTQANELAGTDGGVIYEFTSEDQRFRLLRASETFDAEFLAAIRATPLVYGEGAVGRAAALREPVQIPDVQDPSAYSSTVRDAVLAAGYRALLAVPLISEDEVLGALIVNRRTPGEFEPRVVEVLRTFGTQSALAIQNARLFREIEDKSRQLEAANRHKDEFLASMSHELRTPLNAVIGFSEVLLEKMFGDVNEKQEEYLSDILASGRHLLSLINDILDLAKIEAGRMDLDVEDFDVAEAVTNAVVLVRERATRKSLVLATSLEAGLGSAQGDQRKVKQVLLNLLSNAVKFTPEGGHVEVRAQRLNGQIEIAVTDTGIGIAEEDLDAVFEEFRQVGTDYSKKHEGTGLGLTLSKKFVELHGGRIWVKSQLGQGSTFTFTIPVNHGR
jgi:signal transduction histidine kinase